MHRLIVSLALVGTLCAVAVACGSSTTTGAVTATTTVVGTTAIVGTTGMAGSAGASVLFNTADVTFAQSMVPHHQQAVTMADMALGAKAGASQSVKDLATRIKAAQGPEITMMQGWLTSWGEMTTASTTVMGMDHSTAAMAGTAMSGTAMSGTAMSGTTVTGMDGMMSAADMTALGATTGKPFDTMWLTMMVAHHQGAVTMSQTELTAGTNADAKALAGKIVTAQNAEIAEMDRLLAG